MTKVKPAEPGAARSVADPPGRGLANLNERSQHILRRIVEAYVDTGEPIGSRTLSRQLGLGLSPATIRNVMADLEDAGLLLAPHTSAGRIPTELGMRLFVDGLLEIGNLGQEDREAIEGRCQASGRALPEVLAEASSLVSGLSRCAGLVTAPKLEAPLKHIEFVSLGPGRALVVLVTAAGEVENRIIDVPAGLPPASLVEASNYLTARMVGRSISSAMREIAEELEAHRAELNELTSKVVEAGLATWGRQQGRGGALIVSGQSHLLQDVTGLEDLERIRQLFSLLETKEAFASLLDLTQTAEGVQIFIGTENELFNLAGCSMIVAPYADSGRRLVGAIGVIGPTRIDYARIIPIVDYTAKVVGRLLG